jgi:hypothetical protein
MSVTNFVTPDNSRTSHSGNETLEGWKRLQGERKTGQATLCGVNQFPSGLDIAGRTGYHSSETGRYEKELQAQTPIMQSLQAS